MTNKTLTIAKILIKICTNLIIGNSLIKKSFNCTLCTLNNGKEYSLHKKYFDHALYIKLNNNPIKRYFSLIRHVHSANVV